MPFEIQILKASNVPRIQSGCELGDRIFSQTSKLVVHTLEILSKNIVSSGFGQTILE
jgi:hypothetical protein